MDKVLLLMMMMMIKLSGRRAKQPVESMIEVKETRDHQKKTTSTTETEPGAAAGGVALISPYCNTSVSEGDYFSC